MSAISNFINTIRNAVYGEQVRGAIADAITQCYNDVSSPSLNTAAFATAIANAYADGFLDIQEKSTIAGMTNEKIIYRYTGNAAGYVHNALYYYDGSAWKPIGSGIQIASTAAGMTDTGTIYKYTGSEAGYVTNALYYYNGSEWIAVASKDEILTTSIKNAIIDCLNHVAWTNENGQQYIEALAFAMGISASAVLYMRIGDIATETGIYDSTITKRISTSNAVPVESENVTIVGCPFAPTWSEWSDYGGFGVRCYDENDDYLGYVTPTGGGLFKDTSVSVTLLSGTKKIRLIIQKDNNSFPEGFITSMVNPMYFNNTPYRFARG